MAKKIQPLGIQWREAIKFTDIKYHKSDGIAKITINRPKVRNAFRPLTVIEMSQALHDAREDEKIGVIILTGEGKEAFCSGGDQRVRGEAGYKDEKGKYRCQIYTGTENERSPWDFRIIDNNP